MDLGMEGDAALVTASSSGLGKASAASLAAEGVDVVLNGRDADRLEAAVADVERVATGEVLAQPGDLTDPDDVAAMVARPVEEFGRLDHLVTSAGGPPSGPFLETTDDDWYAAYDLLVMSVVRLVHAAADDLRADGGGTVVTITSRSVKEAIDGLVLSNAVRMGVVGLEKTLARELAPDVRANAVLPGTIETPRISSLVEQALERGEYASYDEGVADWGEDIPMGRIGDPAEFGDVVAFLSSPRASFVNGAAVPVDGGQTRSNL